MNIIEILAEEGRLQLSNNCRIIEDKIKNKRSIGFDLEFYSITNLDIFKGLRNLLLNNNSFIDTLIINDVIDDKELVLKGVYLSNVHYYDEIISINLNCTYLINNDQFKEKSSLSVIRKADLINEIEIHKYFIK